MGYGSGYPAAVESLIDALRQLPGIGRRGAERLALAMLEWEPERQRQLGELVAQLSETVSECPECGALADAGELCAVCRRSDRDPSQICVVETMAQLLAIEASGNYRGRYHVLGGRLSPLDAENGSGLRLPQLLARANSGTVREVILALSSDVEGRATAIYLGRTAPGGAGSGDSSGAGASGRGEPLLCGCGDDCGRSRRQDCAG